MTAGSPGPSTSSRSSSPGRSRSSSETTSSFRTKPEDGRRNSRTRSPRPITATRSAPSVPVPCAKTAQASPWAPGASETLGFPGTSGTPGPCRPIPEPAGRPPRARPVLCSSSASFTSPFFGNSFAGRAAIPSRLRPLRRKIKTTFGVPP